MPIYTYDSGGTRRTVPVLYAYDSGGTRRTVSLVYAYDSGGTRRLVSSALSASATDANGYNSGFASSGTVISDPTSLTVSGGSGSYSYLWSKVSGEDFSISSTTTQNPYWYADVADGGHNAVWKVVVTDTVYGITTEATCSVTLVWANLN